MSVLELSTCCYEAMNSLSKAPLPAVSEISIGGKQHQPATCNINKSLLVVVARLNVCIARIAEKRKYCIRLKLQLSAVFNNYYFQNQLLRLLKLLGLIIKQN